MIKCPVCESITNKAHVLDLGDMPLPNLLFPTREEALNAPRYPLEVVQCMNCLHVHLSTAIDPDTMFDNYVYRSSMSKTYVNHCREMATEIRSLMETASTTKGIKEEISVVDIAGNDGALLAAFRDIFPKMKGISVDPAKNLMAYVEEQGFLCIPDYFNETNAQKTVASGSPAIITATNVLAHTAAPVDLLRAAKSIMNRQSLLVVEVPSLSRMIHGCEFDTIYHEHISYFSIRALKELFTRADLQIISVSSQTIHGGSIRVTASIYGGVYSVDTTGILAALREEEDNLFLSDKLATFKDKVAKRIDSVQKSCALKQNTAAFGASAKGNVLLNSLPDVHISYIIDDTPEKQHMFSPGTGIEIVSREYAENHLPDGILFLAWNFMEEIRASFKNTKLENIFGIFPF